MSLLRTIREDIATALERDPAAHNWVEVMLTYPGFHARQIHRVAHWLWSRRVPLLPRLVSHFGRTVTGIEIHPGAVIGKRLFIDHGMGVVIGETTMIGDNCHLYQGVTLGGTSRQRSKRHPTLADGVTVGAGSQLIGDIRVGEGARIGAGSVVVSNVPAHATVVGVPGHVVAYYDPGDDTVLRLPDPERDRIEQLEQQLVALKQRLSDLESRSAPPATPDRHPARPESV